MRIALAQILSGTDPAANLRAGPRLRRPGRRRRREAGGVPRGDHVPVRRPAGTDRRARRRALGRRCPAHRDRGRHHRDRRNVRPRRRRAGDEHADRGGARAPPISRTATIDKIHLYDAFGFTESRTVAPGHEPVVITVDGVRVGLTVCYDIRFPALYTELARRGAQLIVVCASWGSGPGKLEQWTLLARARALDSMSYIAAAGQADPGDTLTGPGSGSGRADRGGRQPGGLTPGRGGGLGRRRPATGGRRHRRRPGSPRPAKASRCCATAQALLSLIGQNRLGDEPARTTKRRPADVGSVPAARVRSASNANRADAAGRSRSWSRARTSDCAGDGHRRSSRPSSSARPHPTRPATQLPPPQARPRRRRRG